MNVMGSGHKKSNFPVYIYSDDGGITFHRADDRLVNLPITMSQTDTVISPNWVEPNDDGYFYGYTNVSAMPDGKPYVWSSPKDPPHGKRNAFSYYIEGKGWSEPILAPWNAQRFIVDDSGIITFISSSKRVHRSYDEGYTWRNWELDLENGSSLIWIDYSYAQKFNQLRFLAQNKINGELKVYTLTFSAN